MLEYNDDEVKTILLCDKGNMPLTAYKINDRHNGYNLKFDFKNIDPKKVNIETLLSPKIYHLIEKFNSDLIEKIYILNELNPNETDICILIKPIAKELGIKQKYLLFRTTKAINNQTNSVVFYNKDLTYVNPDLVTHYFKTFNLDNNNYEPMIFEYGKTQILLSNSNNNLNNLSLKDASNISDNIDLKFSIDFSLSIKDDIPLHMENFIGLLFKKMFYNVKEFIYKIN
jgi:hypothetical protein